MKKIYLFVAAVSLSVGLYSCFSNPITGRRAINLVDESEMRTAAAQEYRSFLSTSRPITGTRDAEMVQRVGSRLAAAVENYLAQIGQSDLISGYQWEYHLVNNNEANAWCMPGGKIAVYTGIMPLAQNEAGLATVVGHEIAHAVARHANERASEQLLAEYGGQTLGGLIGSNPGAAGGLLNAAIGIGAQGALLKFSRDQESEADHMGLIIMAMAGYNPNEAINFWQRMMAAAGGAKTPEILSTHPSDQTRMNNLKKWIPEAMKYYKPR